MIAGSINTDLALMGPRDIIPYRIGIFAFVSMLMVTAYSGFEFFYEAVRHVPGPSHNAVIICLKSGMGKQRSRVSQRTKRFNNRKLP